MNVADGYNVSGYKQADIDAAWRGGTWDHNDQARYDELVAGRQAAKSKAQTHQSQTQSKSTSTYKPTSSSSSSNSTKNSVGHTSYTSKGEPLYKNNSNTNSSSGKGTGINNSQKQNVSQDNDINTSINGNNNNVFNNQDNSIRQYGGDNRSLVINSGSGGSGNNKYYTAADEAITMGTLSGFYDVDDSPAAQAAFVDMHQTFNSDAQKKYSNVGVSTAAKYSNFQGGNVDINSLQNRIDSTGQRFRDMATIQEVKTYGDRAAQFKYVPFEFGDPIEEVQSNAGQIASGYKEDIANL